MEYRKYRVSLQVYPDRLYRTFYIRTDVTLDKLAEVILKLFRTDETPAYVFFDTEHSYTTDMFVHMNPKGDYLDALTNNPDLNDVWENKKPMNACRLSEMGDEFCFLYDVDEGYRFLCQACGEPVSEDREDWVSVTDGKGAGIFEDDVYTLWTYFDGGLDPDMSEDDDEKEFYMPENLELEKLSDFEKPLDLAEETEIAASAFEEE